jgi:glutathionyl-hydroquinone reductase
MGLLINGVWHDQWYDTDSTGGRFERPTTVFRNWIGGDDSRFPAASGRYHLIVSLACPWAHRTLIVRALKGLQDAIGVSVVHPHMGALGWSFETDFPGTTGDRLHGSSHLHALYTRSRPDYTGRVTVPVLWDTLTDTIVSNESADIVRMLNRAFNAQATNPALDLTPEALLDEIDAINAQVYDRVNNGVYKAGFATSQAAYEEAVTALFEALDALEQRLTQQRALVGDQLTEADWRLFTTLIRFDPVYVGHFKCNLRRLVDYPNLWAYTRALYQTPGIAGTVALDHIKHHYYTSHPGINPSGVVPLGPLLDLDTPHGR